MQHHNHNLPFLSHPRLSLFNPCAVISTSVIFFREVGSLASKRCVHKARGEKKITQNPVIAISHYGIPSSSQIIIAPWFFVQYSSSNSFIYKSPAISMEKKRLPKSHRRLYLARYFSMDYSVEINKVEVRRFIIHSRVSFMLRGQRRWWPCLHRSQPQFVVRPSIKHSNISQPIHPWTKDTQRNALHNAKDS